MTTKFKVGETYQTRSTGDWECIYSWTVESRTAKFITVVETHNVTTNTDQEIRFPPGAKRKRVGVYTYPDDDIERARPSGRYSMAPVISADRHLVEPCQWCSGEYQTARRSPSLAVRQLHLSTTGCALWKPPTTAEVAAELVKTDDPLVLVTRSANRYDSRPFEQISTEDLTYLLDSLEVRRALCLAQGSPTPEINSRLRASIGIELANSERGNIPPEVL